MDLGNMAGAALCVLIGALFMYFSGRDVLGSGGSASGSATASVAETSFFEKMSAAAVFLLGTALFLLGAAMLASVIAR